MMMKSFRTSWLLVVAIVSLIVVAGSCSQRKIDDDVSSKTESEASGKKKDQPTVRPARAERTGLVGNWVLDISHHKHHAYLPLALLEISKTDAGKHVIKLVEIAPEAMPRGVQLRLLSSGIIDDLLVLRFGVPNRAVMIRAQMCLKGTDIRGLAFVTNSYLPNVARFYPTDESTLKKFRSPQPHPDVEEFRKAVNQFRGGFPEQLTGFVEKHPDNPLSFLAIQELDPMRSLANQKDENLQNTPRPTDDELQSHLGRLNKVMPHLGKYANLQSRFVLIRDLLAYRLAPQMAKELIAELEASEVPVIRGIPNKKALAGVRAAAQRELDAQTLRTSKNDDDRSKARKNLQRIRKSSETRIPFYLHALAMAARKAGDRDEALDLFAQLHILPEMEKDLVDDLSTRQFSNPDLRKTIETLWLETHSDTAGLDEYLSRVYQKNIFRYLKSFRPYDEQPETSRTVLCELVTGTDNRAGSALELAVDGLARTFSRSELIVLRYFLSVPKPCPLHCSDSQQRSASTYGAHQPMEFRINGLTNRLSYPGTMAIYPPGYWRAEHQYFKTHEFWPESTYYHLRNAVVSQLERKLPRFKLELSASRSGDHLQFAVNLKPADVPLKDMRLHLVLAEDHLLYTGENGIRRHDMVVRSVVSGQNGISLKKGEQIYKAEVDLKKLRKELSKNGKMSGKNKLLEQDLRNLHVVAFVQNNETKEIHDVTSTVVLGTASQLVNRHLFGHVEAPRPAVQAPPPALPTWPASTQPKSE